MFTRAFTRTPLSTRATLPAAALLLALGAPALAQNAKVYVANSANSRILQVTFDPPSTTQINTDPNALTQIRDLAIRDDGLAGINLIVCDRNGGRVVFYADAFGASQVIFDSSVGPAPQRPDGISLDLAGNLFIMNSGQGASGGDSQVWALKRDSGCPDQLRPECLSGGYRAPLGLIDSHVDFATEIAGASTLIAAEDLPESLVAKSTAGIVQAGDLLVLTNPGALLRYPAADVAAFLDLLALGISGPEIAPQTVIHPPESSVPADRRFPAGVEPNGMAFAPSGDLLITVSDGRILIYGADGHRRSDGLGGFLDFADNAGQGELKIAVGLQDARHRAFVTHLQGGDLRRYTINADGTGTLDAVEDAFQSPVGVDATNSNTVPAPAGSNISVAPTTVLSSNIETVLEAGQVNAKVSTFADPREAEQTIAPNLPLHRSLFLDELRADLPHVEIPAWARAFPFDNPATGVPTFILVETNSSATSAGLLDHLAIEEPLLGYDPDCADPDLTRQPFMFWTPDADDPPIVEGAKFIDITTGCGSIKGLTHNLSYFLVGVRITAPFRDVTAEKLTSLNQVIDSSTCMARKTRQKLQGLMDRADRAFSRNKYADVVTALQAIDAQVEASPQSFSNCSTNTAGEIQARIRSTIFTISKITSAPPNPEP